VPLFSGLPRGVSDIWSGGLTSWDLHITQRHQTGCLPGGFSAWPERAGTFSGRAALVLGVEDGVAGLDSRPADSVDVLGFGALRCRP